MKKHYFLGLAAGRKGAFRQLTVRGREKDRRELEEYLSKRYGGEAILCKNGRSALALALKAYFNRGDKVLVNGFTCYAVYEAVKAAGLVPVWVDVEKNGVNFGAKELETVLARNTAKGVIVQNTLGNPVDMVAIEKIAKKHNLVIIEDLAHSVGVKYADGREAGTVGVATVLSFGKEKAIDTTSGGAVVLRSGGEVAEPSKAPKLSDYLRERWYPAFAAIARGLSYVHLSGIWMRGLIKMRWIEKSADNRLDLERKMPKFEARLALEQLRNKKSTGALRDYYLVRNREEVLAELRARGYYFDGLWYEKPVSPVRYYRNVHFPEKDCPAATEVASKIVNLPKYYSKRELEKAREIIEEYTDARV